MRYVMLALILTVVGCATMTYTPTLRYLIAPEVKTTVAEPCGESLGFRPLEPGQPYKQGIVYRETPYEIGYYANAEWAEMPRDVVTRALSDALAASGRFSDVGNAADMRLPDFVLTGQLRKFDEVRMTEPWTATCEVRLEMRSSRDENAVWAATLSASEPLESHEPGALAAAMSRAVARIVEESVAGIVAANLEPAGKSEEK